MEQLVDQELEGEIKVHQVSLVTTNAARTDVGSKAGRHGE
jgi:hypothetical protein